MNAARSKIKYERDQWVKQYYLEKQALNWMDQFTQNPGLAGIACEPSASKSGNNKTLGDWCNCMLDPDCLGIKTDFGGCDPIRTALNNVRSIGCVDPYTEANTVLDTCVAQAQAHMCECGVSAKWYGSPKMTCNTTYLGFVYDESGRKKRQIPYFLTERKMQNFFCNLTNPQTNKTYIEEQFIHIAPYVFLETDAAIDDPRPENPNENCPSFIEWGNTRLRDRPKIARVALQRKYLYSRNHIATLRLVLAS